jgi:UDPglucose--hexose-1-phosphate uridylyltransferase
MSFNELRKDYLLNRWVVIATSRSRRPTDFTKKQPSQTTTAASTANCPMEPGNEHMTPPAVLVYLKKGNTIQKTKDTNNHRHKNWLIRVVPNLFPAFTPPQQNTAFPKTPRNPNLAPAIGHHEVIIETPHHNQHPSDAPITQLTLTVNACLDRLRTLSKKPYVKYVSIFRNHGLEAGASLSHAHSQLIATPFIPTIVKEEIDASNAYHKKHNRCAYCAIIQDERKTPRFITENPHFITIAPYASINPMEYWILPKKHQTTPLQMTKNETETLAKTLKQTLNALKELVNDPPYNYGFHLTLDKHAHYHWHLEVYPHLAIWAGFEKSTGMYINTMTPETAAESLSNAIST